MIGLLLFASLASADEPDTYARLFGTTTQSAPAPVAAVTAEESPLSPLKVAGPVALAAAAMFLAWRMRAPAAGATIGKPLSIICRHPLGDRTALVLLEVIDADGERRRLLIGTGAGAPSLVADLGQVAVTAEISVEPEAALPSPATVADEVLAERRGQSFASHAASRGVLA